MIHPTTPAAEGSGSLSRLVSSLRTFWRHIQDVELLRDAFAFSLHAFILLVGVALLLVGLLVVLLFGNSLRDIFLKLRSSPAAETENSDGLVEFEGRVRSRDGRRIEAPFSGRKCVACSYEAVYTSSEYDSYDPRASGHVAKAMVIEGDTEEAEVELRDMSLDLPDSKTVLTVDSGERTPEHVVSRVSDYVSTLTTPVYDPDPDKRASPEILTVERWIQSPEKELRFEEGYLLNGDEVRVLGAKMDKDEGSRRLVEPRHRVDYIITKRDKTGALQEDMKDAVRFLLLGSFLVFMGTDVLLLEASDLTSSVSERIALPAAAVFTAVTVLYTALSSVRG